MVHLALLTADISPGVWFVKELDLLQGIKGVGRKEIVAGDVMTHWKHLSGKED